MVKKAEPKNMDSHRLTIRISEDDFQRVKYWADREDESINDFVKDSIIHYIGFMNHDFDISSAWIQRMNQLIDSISILSSNQENLEKVIINSIDSLLEIAKGSNYLLDEESGEL